MQTLELCQSMPGNLCNFSLMPQPWNTSLLFPALADPRRLSFRTKGIESDHVLYCKQNHCLDASSPSATLFERLRKDGLSWSALGIDVSHVQHTRYPNSAKEIIQDSDMKEVTRLLNQARSQVDAEWTQILWESDQPARRSKCDLPGEKTQMLHDLLRDGEKRCAQTA